MLLLKKTKPRKGQQEARIKNNAPSPPQSSRCPRRSNSPLNELFRNDLLKRKAMPKVNQKSQKQLGATKKTYKEQVEVPTGQVRDLRGDPLQKQFEQ